jgi:hypothetical protein
VCDEQIGEDMQHIVGPELSGDLDRQALPRVFVDDREHADRSPVMGSCSDKIIRPDMVRPAGPQTDAGSVVEPQSAALGLLAWDLQPLTSPDPLDPLVIYPPALAAQQRSDPPVAVATVGSGQTHDRIRQSLLVVGDDRAIALRRAGLAERPADTTFADVELLPDSFDTAPAPRGA